MSNKKKTSPSYMNHTEKENYNNRLFEDAFVQLASVIDKDSIEKDRYSINPIMTACQHIGQTMGIDFLDIPGIHSIEDPAEQIKLIAEKSGVSFRKITLGTEWWKKDYGSFLTFLPDGTPAAVLLHSPGHYILINSISNEKIKITEPVAKKMNSFGFCFYKSLPDREIGLKDLLKFCFTHNNYKDFLNIIFLGFLGGILGMVTPVFSGILFDTVIPGAQKGQLIQLTLALLTVTLSITVFHFIRTISFLRITGKVDISVQSALVDRLMKLPVSFFRKYSAGDLADRSNSINSILESFLGVTNDTILSGIFSSLNIFLLFYYSWKLALFAIFSTLIYLIIVLICYYIQLKYARAYVRINGKIVGLVLQLLNGISKLRVAGAEKRAFFIWSKEYTKLRKESFKANTVSNYLEMISSSYPVLITTAIFAIVIFSVEKDFTTGDFIAFTAAFGIFQSSFINMFTSITSILEVLPLYERVQPILKTLPEITQNKMSPSDLKGTIEMNHISFAYSEDSPLVLKDISLKVDPGDYIAIVGPSGSGKSTLLRILLGFEKPNSGSLFYDNHDSQNLNFQFLRKQLGVVLQNGELIPDNIYQNISGTSNCTLDEAWEAAKLAGVHDDINEMPMGMFTFINEGASIISAGQKQRLLIARALVGKPKILLFDEATSAIDNITQKHIVKNLEKIKITKIVIAHRLSTIINADYIYVLDKGKVVQDGEYKKLAKEKGIFRDLIKMQSK